MQHALMGIVDEVGPEVMRLNKGDRVVASFHIAYAQLPQLRILKLPRCSECQMCRSRSFLHV